ncbi:hypothetical protein RM530_09735 [Algiphilus sp. W345]|uniref:Uncharacterized protein n=1 Tax=Banduia mediterranea TaxID=3075609 RepID=A0ABU2WK10_9GAMM|nr:hypothetical protein [Algiphilus sp. W345]MDT0497641.1 hypothetical protein [Algiphilus sp. W345]
MHPLIENNRNTIAELCRRHGVHRLEAFGSILRSGRRVGTLRFAHPTAQAL